MRWQHQQLKGFKDQVVDMAIKCRAWLAFESVLKTSFAMSAQLGCEVTENFYNSWDNFDVRFPKVNDDKVVRRAIQGLCRTGFEVGDDPLLFKRRDIYDKMAYASFPLDWFVETTAKCKVTFSLPLPMVFAVSSFRLKRCRKVHQGDNWWGRLYLHDGRVPMGYSERQVAESWLFPNETTREQMFEALLAKVRERGDECLFTITGDSLIGAMIQAQSEQLLELAEKTS